MTVIIDTSIFFVFYGIKDKYHLDSLVIIDFLELLRTR